MPISFLVKWARSDWVDSEHFRFYLFYFIGCNNFQNCVWVDSSIDRPDLTCPYYSEGQSFDSLLLIDTEDTAGEKNVTLEDFVNLTTYLGGVAILI